MITCYYQTDKEKSKRLCEAFAHGLGRHARITHLMPSELRRPFAGPVVFYGIGLQVYQLWEKAKRENIDWYLIDNSYFDVQRENMYRVTRNKMQHDTLRPPNWERLAHSGIRIDPWQQGGEHILVCPQSDYYMRVLCGWPDGAFGWQEAVVRKLRSITKRRVIVRPWQQGKRSLRESFVEDLKGAWALVTHTSAAANEALLHGVPAFVTGRCAATPLALDNLDRIEDPVRPANREAWAAGLIGAQWTRWEMRSGIAWRDLNSGHGRRVDGSGRREAGNDVRFTARRNTRQKQEAEMAPVVERQSEDSQAG